LPTPTERQMPTQPKVTCFGELLIDMISTTIGDLTQTENFLKKFGGAPANTAVGLAKLGTNVSFIGKVGNDPFGHFLKKELENQNVDTSSLVVSDDQRTTLAFVSQTKTGGRDFYFFRGAHETVSEEEVSLPQNTIIFHLGSLTQTNPITQKATQKLINQARKNKALISYDPNLRKNLWDDLILAEKIIRETAKKVDIFKISEEETQFLTNTKDPQKAAKKLFTKNLQALFITLGPKGNYYKTKKYEGFIPTMRVQVVDTTGAGDAFNAGYLHGIYKAQKSISQMTKPELEKILESANVIAALTTTKKGAITAFPGKEELKRYLIT